MPRRGLLRMSLLALLCAGADWPGDAAELARTWADAPSARRIELVAEAAASRSAEGDALLLRALDDASVDVVLAALDHARRARTTPAATRVLTLLADERAPVRAAAAAAAGAIGDPRAVPALARAAGDSDVSVRERAIEALAQVGGDGATLALIDRVNDAESVVRVAAVRTLGALGDARAALPVLGTLEDPNPDVRVAGAQALGRLRDPRAVRGLRAALGDESVAVRIAATRALGALGPDAVDATDDLAALALREDRTADAASRGPLARAAVDALASIGHPRALELLVRVLREGPEDDLRAAVDALTRAPAQARARVTASLLPLPERAPDPVIELLGALGDGPAATALLGVVDARRGPAERRRRALVSLGRTGDPRAVRALLRAADEPPEPTQSPRRASPCEVSPSFSSALAGLRAFVDRSGALPAVALDPLAAMLQRPPPACVEVVVSLIDLVGATGNPRARARLDPYLAHAAAPLRAASLRALARLREGDVGIALERLADPSPDVRLAAADLLSRRGTASDRDALIRAIEAPARRDRTAAIGALGALAARHGPGQSVTTLERVAREAAPALRGAAMDALGRVAATGDVASREALRGALHGADEPLRRAAIEAFGNAMVSASPETRAALARVVPNDLSPDPTLAWALRAHPDAEARLIAWVDAPRRAVACNAAAALAFRHAQPSSRALDHADALCATWRARGDEGVRANLARALILGGAPCASAVAAAMLRAEESPIVRRAIASAITTRGAQGDERALARCAAGDASAEVAAHCARLRDAGASAPSARVDLSARDADDAAIEGGAVRVTLSDGAVVWALTGPEGWVHLEGVAAGPYSLAR